MWDKLVEKKKLWPKLKLEVNVSDEKDTFAKLYVTRVSSPIQF